MPDYKKLITKKRLSNQKAKRLHPVLKKTFKGVLPFILYLVLVLAVALGLRYFIFSYSGFKIREVHVVDKDGNVLNNAEAIFSPNEANIFKLDIKQLSGNIQQRYPEFASVDIRKQFPDKILIMTKSREPVAFVISGGGCLVDSQGFILPYNSAHKDLPKIIGVRKTLRPYERANSLRLERALYVLKQLKSSGVYPEYAIAKIDLRQYANVVLYLKNNIKIKMGEGEFSEKAIALSKLLKELDLLEIEYIDMRFGNPVVKPRR